MNNFNKKITINDENFSIDKSVDLISSYLNNYNTSEINKYLNEIHNADIAEILQNLDPVLRLSLINIIGKNFDPEILTYLNDSLRDEIVEILDLKQLASNSAKLDVDDAVDLIEDLKKSDQETFLENVEEKERKLIQEGLNYPEDSAGRLMQRKFVAVNEKWNVGNAIDFLRNNKKELP